jgi:hypothetical protein
LWHWGGNFFVIIEYMISASFLGGLQLDVLIRTMLACLAQ